MIAQSGARPWPGPSHRSSARRRRRCATPGPRAPTRWPAGRRGPGPRSTGAARSAPLAVTATMGLAATTMTGSIPGHGLPGGCAPHNLKLVRARGGMRRDHHRGVEASVAPNDGGADNDPLRGVEDDPDLALGPEPSTAQPHQLALPALVGADTTGAATRAGGMARVVGGGGGTMVVVVLDGAGGLTAGAGAGWSCGRRSGGRSRVRCRRGRVRRCGRGRVRAPWTKSWSFEAGRRRPSS